jgi:short-subunit dehydrogenase
LTSYFHFLPFSSFELYLSRITWSNTLLIQRVVRALNIYNWRPIPLLILASSKQAKYGGTSILFLESMTDTNFWSVLAMVKAFSPLIIAAKGKIINIGAATGVMTQAYWVCFEAVVLFIDD